MQHKTKKFTAADATQRALNLKDIRECSDKIFLVVVNFRLVIEYILMKVMTTKKRNIAIYVWRDEMT